MKRVLLIDDEEAFARNVVKPYLEDTGRYEVRALTSGVHALDVCREYKPDLIFVDVMMRDMAGPQVVRLLESDENTRSIPLVFLTATHTRDAGSDELYDGVINGRPFLAKPVALETLLKCAEREAGDAA